MIRPVQQPERDTHNVDVADGDNPLRPGREPCGAPHAVAACVPCVGAASYRATSDDGGRVVIAGTLCSKRGLVGTSRARSSWRAAAAALRWGLYAGWFRSDLTVGARPYAGWFRGE